METVSDTIGARFRESFMTPGTVCAGPYIVKSMHRQPIATLPIVIFLSKIAEKPGGKRRIGYFCLNI
jgi:hypothetical protein